jgi:hypothetical protein
MTTVHHVTPTSSHRKSQRAEGSTMIQTFKAEFVRYYGNYAIEGHVSTEQ